MIRKLQNFLVNRIIIIIFLLLLLAFFIWQSYVSFFIKIHECELQQEDMKIMSRPSYDWMTISKKYPYGSINFCRSVVIHIQQNEKEPYSCLRVHQVNFKSCLGDQNLLFSPIQKNFHYSESKNEFTYSLPTITDIDAAIWGDFTLTVEIEFEQNGMIKNKIFEFHHMVELKKSYSLFFWGIRV